MHPILPCLLILGALAAGEVAPYVPPTVVPIAGLGHRYDGKGVYPDKPPTSFDEKTGANMRWKVELPNWSYAAPLPVGNRVLVLADSDARFIWPVLYCYDAATGALAWQAEVNPLDAFPGVPAEERKQVTDIVTRLWDDNRALFTAMIPVTEATGGCGPEHPALIKANQELAARGLKVEKYARSYGTLRYVTYPTEYKTLQDDLWKKYNIQPNLSNQGSGRTGDAFGTPVSDGERVYVQTIHGTMAAFDLATGKRTWIATIGGGKYREANHYMTSPRMCKDLVIACFGDTNAIPNDVVVAYDRLTGKELWRHDKVGSGGAAPGSNGGRVGSSPLILRIGTVDVCILGTGQVLRLPDGKPFAATVGNTLVPFAVDEAGGAIFTGTSTDRGSDRYRLDLAITGDTLTVTPRWIVHKSRHSYNVVFHDGMLYWNGYRIDPNTGWPSGVKNVQGDDENANKAIYNGRTPDTPRTMQFLLIANGHVYGLDEGGGKGEGKKGILEVYTLDGKPVSRNLITPAPPPEHLQRQGFGNNFSYSCPMNIGGDCIYIMDNLHLYCIGAK
jgi:outer membrane protein assembly factor BamB